MSYRIDLGKSMRDVIGPADIKGPDDKSYPDLYISDSDDPKIADLPDKGECTIRYRICSRTHREEKNGDGKKKHTCSVRMEILSISGDYDKKKKNGNGYGDDARKNFKDYFKDK